MSETLFDGYEPPEAPVSPPRGARGDTSLSADRRRTLRQAQEIAEGRHPLMTGPLHPEASRTAQRGDAKNLPFRCGSCVHRVDRGWPKCDLTTMSRSAASDVRAWWPACERYELKELP